MTKEAQRIAETVGWRVGFPNKKGGILLPYQWENELTGERVMELPDYLNNPAAALSLCDFLTDQGWTCSLNNGLDKTWECQFQRPPTDQTNPDDIGGTYETLEIHYGPGPTLPEAICEAFLKALNLWK